DAAGRRPVLPATRRRPGGRRQRERGDPVAGHQVRGTGLPARGRRRALRTGTTSVDVRLRIGLRFDGGPGHRVRRPSARALRRSGGRARRPVPGAQRARLLRDHAAGDPRRVRLPPRSYVDGGYPVMAGEFDGLAAIVNTCSIAAHAGLPQRALYSASKGAVQALTLAMAADHIREGIRVTCVNPGTADTPWVRRLLAQADDPDAELAALNARQPSGR